MLTRSQRRLLSQGQDIKVLFMKNGDIANFRLSNSCSAGNGMLLQATADSFGVPVTKFAEVAFEAELAPKFSYGCAVFLDTDRVNLVNCVRLVRGRLIKRLVGLMRRSGPRAAP